MPKRFLRSQIQQIAVDPVLRIYGVFVSAFVLLPAVLWLHRDVGRWLGPGPDALCWPMFPDCHAWRVWGAFEIQATIVLMGGLALAAALLFWRQRIQAAWWLLLASNLIKYAVIAVDFRMRLNQHIMAFWITLAFLFLPSKKPTIKILAILFYFWAGIIKLTPEWLSGQALYIKPWLLEDGPLLIAACYYVVFLEIVLIWALLWERSRWAWATLAQLALFHLFSFKIVGYFYPLLMYAILAIFPLSWRWQATELRLVDQIKTRSLPATAIVVALVFSALQIAPKFRDADTALTGEGRLFSLHMFDAYSQCRAIASIRVRDGKALEQDLYTPLPPRIHCDPIVFWNRARNLCRANHDNPQFVGLDLYAESKQRTAKAYQPLINIKNFCAKDIGYSIWGGNNWILKP